MGYKKAIGPKSVRAWNAGSLFGMQRLYGKPQCQNGDRGGTVVPSNQVEVAALGSCQTTDICVLLGEKVTNVTVLVTSNNGTE